METNQEESSIRKKQRTHQAFDSQISKTQSCSGVQISARSQTNVRRHPLRVPIDTHFLIFTLNTEQLIQVYDTCTEAACLTDLIPLQSLFVKNAQISKSSRRTTVRTVT